MDTKPCSIPFLWYIGHLFGCRLRRREKGREISIMTALWLLYHKGRGAVSMNNEVILRRHFAFFCFLPCFFRLAK